MLPRATARAGAPAAEPCLSRQRKNQPTSRMLGTLNTDVIGRLPGVLLHRVSPWRRVTAPLLPGGPMARLTPASGTIPLVTGIATATVLSGAAVLTVVHAGCDEPGSYRMQHGAVELVGGCISPEDIPVAPKPPAEPTPRPLGEASSTVTLLRP
ncbi:hypothetical protein [Haloactinomyces albus]|uniref:Uncharacterized protein n=1 Tax=Haloactinomyces albus TaxID=1352928 RepID=A0AAE4CLY0_9ACTN|nr:hypothetical protein [Haloactinomyces albus]MDR7302710.1 hypothetical protein [Haloactinomyces albus]